MLRGESHGWSCAASGWLKRSFFVRFRYAFKALSKINWKLDVDVAGG